MEKPEYNLTKAKRVTRGTLHVGYVLQVSEEVWVPLDLEGRLLGPPSYKEDATATVLRETQ